MKEWVSGFTDIGSNIVDGIRSGIEDAWDGLVRWFNGLWDGLVGGVKNFLGIASPSKVFAGIGAMMAKGVGVGFELQMPKELPGIKESFDINGISAYTAATTGNAPASEQTPRLVVNQNVYATAMTPSQAMTEAEYAFERAVMTGV